MRLQVRVACDVRDAAALVLALTPELKDLPDGVTASAEVEEPGVVVAIEARDDVGLRAAANGILRLTDTCLAILGGPEQAASVTVMGPRP